MKKNIDLKSSVGDKYFTRDDDTSFSSDEITQIIHFKDGQKRTISGILSETIRQGQFTKFKLKDGSMVMINDNNVNMIEVFRKNKK